MGDSGKTASEQVERFIHYTSVIRGGRFVKEAVIEGRNARVSYFANFHEYKSMNPDSNITESDYEDYWSTGDAIHKALHEEPLRILREFDDIDRITFTHSFHGTDYSVTLSRQLVEEYFKVDLKRLHEDKELTTWKNEVVKKFFNKVEQQKYIDRFVKQTFN